MVAADWAELLACAAAVAAACAAAAAACAAAAADCDKTVAGIIDGEVVPTKSENDGATSEQFPFTF